VLGHGPAAGRQDHAGCLERLVEQLVAFVWRVDDHDVERLRGLRIGAPAEPAKGVVAYDHGIRAAEAGPLQVGGNDPGGRGVVLDEGGRRRAARERLDARRPAAGEQVEHPGAGQVRFEDREQRLLHAIGERSRSGTGRFEADAARRPGDHPARIGHGQAALFGSASATCRSQPPASSAASASLPRVRRPRSSSSASA
jgi:hypothetical protein